jgi:hypothetical protein
MRFRAFWLDARDRHNNRVSGSPACPHNNGHPTWAEAGDCARNRRGDSFTILMRSDESEEWK